MPDIWIYVLIGALVLVGLVVLLAKVPQSRLVVFTFLGIGLVASTVYCGVNLDHYFNSKGGIFGAITGIFDTNTVEVENLSFSLSNIEMTQESGDTYSAKVLDNSTIASLDAGEEYCVYVNGQPCYDVETASDYVVASYEYSFLDENFVELCHDTLSIKFSFYNNATYLSVSTSGGSTAVKYWNYYFQKENFVIEISTPQYRATSYNYIYGEYDSEKIMRITYMVNGEEMFAQAYTVGSYLTFPEYDDENFYCWSTTPQDEGINRVNANEYHRFYENTTLYAIFLEEHIVRYTSEGELVNTEIVKTGFTPTYSKEPTRTDYTFAGWSIDGLTEVDTTAYVVESDVEFIALWKTKVITLTIQNTANSSGHQNEYLEVHTLTTLTPPEEIECMNGTASFSHWEIVSGDGVVVDNQFNAGSEDCVVNAIYDKTIIRITTKTDLVVTYLDNDYQFTLPESATSATVKLCCSNSGSVTISYQTNYAITCEDEGVSIINNNDGTYTVSWTSLKLVNIKLNQSVSVT